MHTHLVHSVPEWVDDELDLLTVYLLYYLLQHMIPICVFYALIDLWLNFINNDISLHWSQYFQCFLYDSASKLVKC
jgi:hypothetical protein